jgi:hypothetical protein
MQRNINIVNGRSTFSREQPVVDSVDSVPLIADCQSDRLGFDVYIR